MDVTAFDWDFGNASKCKKHGLALDEIEEVFASNALRISPDERHSATEQRWLAIGPNAHGRMVFIAFTFREREGSRLIRPVSARYMHSKEIEAYEKAFSKFDNR